VLIDVPIRKLAAEVGADLFQSTQLELQWILTEISMWNVRAGSSGCFVA